MFSRDDPKRAPEERDREPAWRRYLRFWRSDATADVDEELRFHLESRVAERILSSWWTIVEQFTKIFELVCRRHHMKFHQVMVAYLQHLRFYGM